MRTQGSSRRRFVLGLVLDLKHFAIALELEPWIWGIEGIFCVDTEEGLRRARLGSGRERILRARFDTERTALGFGPMFEREWVEEQARVEERERAEPNGAPSAFRAPQDQRALRSDLSSL